MIKVKKLILDILKPHQPNSLEFASALAEQDNEIQIRLTVTAVDEKTESVIIVVEGNDINFEKIAERIKELGGSVHSIDEVQVTGSAKTEENSAD